MAQQERNHVWIESVTLDTTAAATDEILYAPWICGEVILPTTAAASITGLTWYAAEKSGGTYLAAYDDAGVAVTQTVSHSKSYPIPVALAGCHYIKPVVNAAGTVHVLLKG